MNAIIFALGVVGFLLLSSEFLWRKKLIHGEYGRKLVHTLMGIYVASWPYIMNQTAIQVIACCAILTLLASRKYQLFHAIHDVDRLTYGELLYPIGVLMISLLARADWIFSLAILLIALADGMAAVFGKKYGSKHKKYKIKGTAKSTVGTATYIIFAYISVGIAYVIGGSQPLQNNLVTGFVVIPLGTAVLELLSPYGIDNITVPLLAIMLCNAMIS